MATLDDAYRVAEKCRASLKGEFVRKLSLGRVNHWVLESQNRVVWSSSCAITKAAARKLEGRPVLLRCAEKDIMVGETRKSVCGFLDKNANWSILELEILRQSDLRRTGSTPVKRYRVSSCDLRTDVSLEEMLQLSGDSDRDIERVLDRMHSMLRWGADSAESLLRERRFHLEDLTREMEGLRIRGMDLYTIHL